jgi:hypothetical protein
MKQNQARYGFIIADAELVSVKRMPNDGNLALAYSISCTRQGNGRLTVLPGVVVSGHGDGWQRLQLYASLIMSVGAPNQSDPSTYLLYHGASHPEDIFLDILLPRS